MILKENSVWKTLRAKECGYNFNKVTGYMEVWGRTQDENLEFSPYGPFIADIEISTACDMGPICKACYKSNIPDGKYMPLETFKSILSKLPKVLTQIAFGIGNLNSSPVLFDIMKHCRENGIIPNITINGAHLTDYYADNLAKYVGAIAVSNYGQTLCYNAVKKLTDRGMTQVNIHQLLALETKDQVYQLIEDIQNDNRLEKLNAVVFLGLKQKGRGVAFNRLPDEDFQNIIDLCFEKGIRFGLDSCNGNRFSNVISERDDYEQLIQMVEPCESSIQSAYINVLGEFFPCSFAEEGQGLSVANCNNFLEDIWMNPKTIEWRKKLLDNGRNCPIYDV